MSSDVLRIGIPRGAYAERDDPHLSWLDDMGERASGLLLRRLRANARHGKRIVTQVSELEAEMEGMGELQIMQTAKELRVALHRDGFRDDHVARSFALVRAAAQQKIGQPRIPRPSLTLPRLMIVLLALDASLGPGTVPAMPS